MIHKIEIYKDKKSEFRWRLFSANGRVIADSGEGYTRKDNLNRALQVLHKAFTSQVDIVDLTS